MKDLLPFQVLGVDIYLPYLKDGTSRGTGPYSGSLVVTCLGSGFQRLVLLKGPITAKSVCSALSNLFNNSLWHRLGHRLCGPVSYLVIAHGALRRWK